MPYIIKPSKEEGKKGYKVCKRDDPSRCFSQHPLSKERAIKQRTAIILSELGLSKQRTGGVGSGESKKPSTIQEIKEYLNYHGHADKVFDLVQKKGKKSDWVALLNSVMNEIEHVPMIPAETAQQMVRGDLSIAKDATEAFKRLGLTDKKTGSGKKKYKNKT